MAFHGDCSSYPVPELLQWLDASRKTGALHLTWESGDRKLFLLAGQVVATAAPGLHEAIARVLAVGQEFPGANLLADLKAGQLSDRALGLAVRQLCEEDTIASASDVTAAASGRFHWTEDPDRGEDEWVSLEMPVRELVFESLRRLDEGSDVEQLIPDDHRLLRARPGPLQPHVLHRVIVRLASGEQGMALGRLWLALGLSRTMVGRAVFDLVRAGALSIEGISSQFDPVADMLEQGALLLRERQFDAAGLVFATLLKSDPQDRRVRDFARLVEREHLAHLYREISPIARFHAHEEPTLMQFLRPEERNLVHQVKAGLDVSGIVLAAGLTEVEVLKLLQKLVRQGVLSPLE